MGKVFLQIAMSLDGFIAGPDDGPEKPMGTGGLRLHKWLGMRNDKTGTPGKDLLGADREVFEDLMQSTGAIVSGRRTFDIVSGWDGTHPVNAAPVFVLSDSIPDDVPKGKSTFTFVTDGIDSAIAQAREAAGDKDVYVLGGASIAQQCINAGLLDEMRIDVVPVLFGSGIRLFDYLCNKQIELKKLRVADGSDAIHLKLQVVN